MARYQGLVKQPDNIVGGGSWVQKNGTGHEVCNFLPVPDGYVYGHVESSQKDIDRQIRIEKWGDGDESLSGIDLVWTATHPQEGGRRVVGWYRDATIFRKRQPFDSIPSKQHRIDSVDSYRACALARDAHVLDIDERTLVMPRGRGWMGQTAWWSPPDDGNTAVRKFVEEVRNLLSGTHSSRTQSNSAKTKAESNSPDAANDPYTRYMQAYEMKIDPRHNKLQGQFTDYLDTIGAKSVRANLDSVDLRYNDSKIGRVLVEVKPCEPASVRYAVRTAMGQLLDYRQRADATHAMLIVIEVEPKKEDKLLASANGFGVAYPAKGGFKIVWPI